MDKVIIEAEKRETIGKHVKTLRRAGKIPAVIYGKGMEALPITLDRKITTNTLGKVSTSTILNVKVGNQEHATLVREIQKDHIKQEILHIDFQAVSLKEKLRTSVSINLFGEAPVLKEYEALIVSGINSIEVECLPQDLPESIEVDLVVLKELGDAIYVKDLPVPANVEFLTDPEELVAVASAVKEEAVVEEVLEEVEGGIEPKVLEHGKKEEETED